MQEKNCERAKRTSFGEFLSCHRIAILVILLLALTFRVVLAVRYSLPAGDEGRYTTPAINMLASRGFSSDRHPPYAPSEHAVPLYPLFVAAVYKLFGKNNLAVRLAQSLLDLLTCLLLAFVSFNLAPALLRRSAAILSLATYGCLSWFTLQWTRYVLTETLALFLTVLAVAVTIVALRKGRWLWLVAGATCGLALLTRPDSLLLVAAFILFLILQIVRRRTSAIVNLLLFSLAVAVILAPWVLRNYVVLKKFQPLASEYGFAREGYMPTGYLQWIRTWLTDETHFNAFDPAFLPGHSFDPHELPDSVFDSKEEKEQVVQLLARSDQQGRFTPELDDKFRALANERIKRAPLRFFVWLPLKRITSIWLTGFATHNRFHRFLRILFVLPILILGALGFAFWARNPALTHLLLLIMLTRTVFLAYHYAPEARYIVEAYPAMIAACSVSGAVLWRYLNRRWKRRWVRGTKEAVSS